MPSMTYTMAMPRFLFPALILLIAAGALAIRLPHLADRPLHNDEGVNADKFRETYEHGTLRYDPRQYHGPALWFLTLPFAWLSGHHAWIDLTEFNYRLVSVVCGVGVVLSLLLMRDALGTRATIWSALFIALSPAMVYYSRDYIHEMMLTMFTSLVIASGWRWFRGGKLGWAIVNGLFVGLMLATKETTLVIVNTMFAGIMLAIIWQKYGEREPITRRPWLTNRHVLSAVMTAIIVTLLMYSSFGRDLPSLARAATFFQTYSSRAAGQIGHVQPPTYYFNLLVHQKLSPAATGWWSESLLVALACIGTIKVLFFAPVLSPSPGTPGEGRGEGSAHSSLHDHQLSLVKNPHPDYRAREQACNPAFGRFLVFYTFAAFTAFSLISYKTPWNVLSPLLGLILLAGIGVSAIPTALRPIAVKSIVAIPLLGGTAQLGHQAYQASYVYAADVRNQYVYAQTNGDALKLVDLMETLARLSPEGHHLAILIGTSESPWPLPWYLRGFSQVGYYESAPPWLPQLKPAVVIVSTDLAEGLDPQYLDTKLYEQANSRGLRPGVVLAVYLRKDVWSALIAERSRLHAAKRPK